DCPAGAPCSEGEIRTTHAQTRTAPTRRYDRSGTKRLCRAVVPQENSRVHPEVQPDRYFRRCSWEVAQIPPPSNPGCAQSRVSPRTAVRQTSLETLAAD